MRSAFPLLVLLLAALLPAQARSAGNGNTHLIEAKALYQRVEYERALTLLEQAAQSPSSTPADLVETQLYMGLCRYALGEIAPALEHFRLALARDPALVLPPATNPRIVVEVDGLRQQIKPWDLPSSPAAPILPPDSPPVASVSKGPRLGKVPLWFGVGAVAAGGVGTYFGLSARSHERTANDPSLPAIERNSASGTARAHVTAANIALGLAAGAAVTALVTYIVGL